MGIPPHNVYSYAEAKTSQARVFSLLEKCSCCKAGEHKAPGWSRQFHTKQDKQSQSWDLADLIESLWPVTSNDNAKFLGYRATTHAEFFQIPQNQISSPNETLDEQNKDTLVYISHVVVL